MHQKLRLVKRPFRSRSKQCVVQVQVHTNHLFSKLVPKMHSLVTAYKWYLTISFTQCTTQNFCVAPWVNDLIISFAQSRLLHNSIWPFFLLQRHKSKAFSTMVTLLIPLLGNGFFRMACRCKISSDWLGVLNSLNLHFTYYLTLFMSLCYFFNI